MGSGSSPNDEGRERTACSDGNFEEAVVFAECWGEDLRVKAFGGEVGCNCGVESAGQRLHEGAGAVKGAVDDGEVVDFGAAEKEGEVDVPESLEALRQVRDERLGL